MSEHMLMLKMLSLALLIPVGAVFFVLGLAERDWMWAALGFAHLVVLPIVFVSTWQELERRR